MSTPLSNTQISTLTLLQAALIHQISQTNQLPENQMNVIRGTLRYLTNPILRHYYHLRSWIWVRHPETASQGIEQNTPFLRRIQQAAGFIENLNLFANNRNIANENNLNQLRNYPHSQWILHRNLSLLQREHLLNQSNLDLLFSRGHEIRTSLFHLRNNQILNQNELNHIFERPEYAEDLSTGLGLLQRSGLLDHETRVLLQRNPQHGWKIANAYLFMEKAGCLTSQNRHRIAENLENIDTLIVNMLTLLQHDLLSEDMIALLLNNIQHGETIAHAFSNLSSHLFTKTNIFHIIKTPQLSLYFSEGLADCPHFINAIITLNKAHLFNKEFADKLRERPNLAFAIFHLGQSIRLDRRIVSELFDRNDFSNAITILYRTGLLKKEIIEKALVNSSFVQVIFHLDLENLMDQKILDELITSEHLPRVILKVSNAGLLNSDLLTRLRSETNLCEVIEYLDYSHLLTNSNLSHVFNNPALTKLIQILGRANWLNQGVFDALPRDNNTVYALLNGLGILRATGLMNELTRSYFDVLIQDPFHADILAQGLVLLDQAELYDQRFPWILAAHPAYADHMAAIFWILNDENLLDEQAIDFVIEHAERSQELRNYLAKKLLDGDLKKEDVIDFLRKDN